jgi:hypothetical protein
MDKVAIRKSGEYVSSGDPILTISPDKPNEIIAYAPNIAMDQIYEGKMVELVKANPPYQIAASKIESIGPVLDIMPTQLWTNPAIPQWGRPFVIKVPPQFNLIPGETVNIREL